MKRKQPKQYAPTVWNYPSKTYDGKRAEPEFLDRCFWCGGYFYGRKWDYRCGKCGDETKPTKEAA